MSDPIEKLNRLGDALEGAPMPLPASEIRARGDRIRRRRHAMIAGVSAAVVAAVSVPVLALALGGNDKADAPFSPQPSVFDPVPSAPLSADNLLTDEDAGQIYGSDSSWVAYDTYPGDGQSSYHPCAESSFVGLGAKPVFKREFNPVPSRYITGSMTAIAGEFPSAADAKAAYDDLSSTLASCAGGVPDGTGYHVVDEADVPVPVDAQAHRILAEYSPVPDDHARREMETGLVLAGNRLEVIVSVIAAQDYLEQLSTVLPKAAQRLVLGGGTGEDPPPGETPTTIPADFGLDYFVGDPPLADTDTTISGPGASIPGANPETACGVVLAFPNAGSPDPDHELGFAVDGVEGYDGRTIHAYPTAQDAVDQMELLRSQIRGCDRDNGGDGLSSRVWRTFSSATGYDSVTFGWYYQATQFQDATAGALYTVLRVGNAIVAIDWSGEYSADAQKQRAPNQVQLARAIGYQMTCVFSTGGC